MKVKDKDSFEKDKDSFSWDLYSMKIVEFAERWAYMMEVKISEGCKLEDIAGELFYDVDIDGVTSQMYDIAVVFLVKHWIYGEDLKNWHNKKYGYTGEGVHDIINIVI